VHTDQRKQVRALTNPHIIYYRVGYDMLQCRRACTRLPFYSIHASERAAEIERRAREPPPPPAPPPQEHRAASRPASFTAGGGGGRARLSGDDRLSNDINPRQHFNGHGGLVIYMSTVQRRLLKYTSPGTLWNACVNVKIQKGPLN
jgi:hypothetical protein